MAEGEINPQSNPLTLDPRMLALLQGLGQPTPQQVAPTMAPPSATQQPATTQQPPADAMELARQSQARGLQEMTTQLAMERTPIQKAQELATAPYSTPDPKYGFTFSHNPVLRSIEAILAATGPGQAVEGALHGGGRAARAAEMRQRSEEIEALVGKEGVAGAAAQPMGAISGLTYHPMMAAARAEQAGAAVMNAQNRAVHDRAMEGLRGQFQQLQAQIAAGKLTAEQARTQAQILIGRGHDQAIRDVAGTSADQRDRDAQIKAFEDEYKLNTDNMFKDVFGGMLGIAPTAPSAKPEAPAGPKAAGSAVKAQSVPKGTVVYDPQGQAHSSDGTHPLPKGWSLSKPAAKK